MVLSVSRARSSAPASVTAGYDPRPMSLRLVPIVVRKIHDFAPVTLMESPRPGTVPTMCSLASVSRLTSSAVSAFAILGMFESHYPAFVRITPRYHLYPHNDF